MIIETGSVEQTRAFGARLAKAAKPGDIFALNGDLGCGKTELVRGFVLGIAPGVSVQSPTFSIVNVYNTPRFFVYHFDFYRLCEVGELDQTGFEEYISSDGVCLIEWADMFAQVLPENTLSVRLLDTGIYTRRIETDFEL